MPEQSYVAIIDYGMGNLFSVQRACAQVGRRGMITSSREELLASEAVILPGVGAFGDAMATLRRLDLVSVLRDIAASGKPLVGICLGMQLLMSESEEFGRHRGLGIIHGDVVRLQPSIADGRTLKVPQVGWNHVVPTDGATWTDSFLDGVMDGEFMYFVHSFYPRPIDPHVRCSLTTYGPTTFCSSLCRGNVFACQFHPERSGPQGLRIYRNLAAHVLRTLEGIRS